jgi:hypothetical protein
VKGLLMLALVSTGFVCTVTALAVSAPSYAHDDAQPCAPSDVRGLVTSFIQAFNRGEGEVLDRLYAKEPDFKWYSTGGPGVRLRGAAMDRSSLLRYFEKRHTRAERLRLRTFRFTGNTKAQSLKSYGNFVFTLTRRAGDLAPTPYQGKGAAHCYAGDDQIIVWSMAKQIG